MAEKKILLFPGQGSQYIGMGKALSAIPECNALLKTADEIMGVPLSKFMFEGPEDELKKTEYTQPALFVVSMMAWELLKKKAGLSFHYAAGHSLGEYSALCAAGVFDFTAGLRLVKLRGELMSKAGAANPGAMSAILGLEIEPLRKVIADVSGNIVVVANHNTPTQIVISGETVGIEKAEAACLAAGAKKAVRLPVSGAFHSPLMDFATSGLRAQLEKTTFNKPNFPIITNFTATACDSPAELKELLVKQLTGSVLWVDSINKAVELGCTSGVELGAGKVIKGLVRGISRDFKVDSVETPEDIEVYTSSY